jgi:hypothetical protein
MLEKELEKILSEAVALKAEMEIIEFKEAKEGYDFEKIGKYFSALSNEANLKGKPFAWMFFGVEKYETSDCRQPLPDRQNEVGLFEKGNCRQNNQSLDFYRDIRIAKKRKACHYVSNSGCS